AAPHHRVLDRGTREFALQVGTPRWAEAVALHIEAEDWVIIGRVDGITDQGLLSYRPATVKPRDCVRAWITHVALAAETGDAGTARLVGTNEEIRWRSPADPRAILTQLIEGYRSALAAPLPVFEKASHTWATWNRTSKTPLEAAREQFDAVWDFRRQKFRGDATDAHIALCWRGRHPFDTHVAEFERWSGALWEPALAHEVAS
ncbi:MAG: hypothetical protein M3Y31_04580, partial [Gemmatimonadota bacterium]|nr:hypothetical protein [Gemmatimonadota bacterium]